MSFKLILPEKSSAAAGKAQKKASLQTAAPKGGATAERLNQLLGTLSFPIDLFINEFINVERECHHALAAGVFLSVVGVRADNLLT